MKKVVVIGGGFAGSTIARLLENKFDIILIDWKDYFEFTPGVLRTIVEPEHMRKIQVMHKDYLKRAKILMGHVSEVGEKYVIVDGKRIKFDYLCICSGSKYNAQIKERNLVISTRANHLIKAYKNMHKSRNILIVGGGLVGVELAAEISTHENKNITIVHSHDILIERNHEKAVRYAEKYLRKRGVNIIFNEKVIDSTEEGKIYNTDKGRKIETDIAFLCTGIEPNYKFMKRDFSDLLNSNNQIRVNRFLQLDGKRNIFVPGDVNNLHVEKTAQNAERQARVVAKNIISLDSGKKMREYREKRTPMVISLGKWNGIFAYKNFIFTGLIPGIMKSLIEWKEMMKFKIRVFLPF